MKIKLKKNKKIISLLAIGAIGISAPVLTNLIVKKVDSKKENPSSISLNSNVSDNANINFYLQTAYYNIRELGTSWPLFENANTLKNDDWCINNGVLSFNGYTFRSANFSSIINGGMASTIEETIFKLLYQTISYDIFNDSEYARNNTDIVIENISYGINGAVIIDYRAIVRDTSNEEVKLYSKTNSAILVGFSLYQATDTDKYNNFNVELKRELNYSNIPTTLPQNFFDDPNSRVSILENWIKENWSWFFNIKDGVCSNPTISSNPNPLELFRTSIDYFFKVIFNGITNVIIIDIEKGEIRFNISYISQYKNNDLSQSLEQNEEVKITFTPFAVKQENGFTITQWIGIGLSLGGGALLLIAMIILLIKKSKSNSKNDDEQFNHIQYIPNEYTDFVTPYERNWTQQLKGIENNNYSQNNFDVYNGLPSDFGMNNNLNDVNDHYQNTEQFEFQNNPTQQYIANDVYFDDETVQEQPEDETY